MKKGIIVVHTYTNIQLNRKEHMFLAIEELLAIKSENKERNPIFFSNIISALSELESNHKQIKQNNKNF